MYTVRFLKITRHLRKKLVRRYTDIYRKSLFAVHLLSDPVRRLDRRAKKPLGPCHIHKCFIHAELLNRIRILLQDSDKRLGLLPIHCMMRLHKRQIRAFAQRIHDRLSRHNAVPLSRNRLGEDHSVARLNIASDRGRNLS